MKHIYLAIDNNNDFYLYEFKPTWDKNEKQYYPIGESMWMGVDDEFIYQFGFHHTSPGELYKIKIPFSINLIPTNRIYKRKNK